MKNTILILCSLTLLLSCRKENNEESPATFITKDYDSLVVKSYDSIVCYNPPYGEYYCRYFPEQNHVSFLVDFDQDSKNDYSIELSHSLYIGSPHFEMNVLNVYLVPVDTNYRVAVTQNNDWSDLVDFKVGDTINNSSIFRSNGNLVKISPFGYTFILNGNIHIGFRKGSNSSFYSYGFLNLIVDGTKVTLIKSILNTNKDECIVEY
jgi:hypothetical protein